MNDKIIQFPAAPSAPLTGSRTQGAADPYPADAIHIAAATLQSTSKNLVRSKVFWLQILTVILSLFPAVQQWIATNPVEAIAVLGAVNTLVRFATRDRVTLFPDPAADVLDARETDDSGKGGGFGMLPLGILACMMATGLMGFSLTSCGPNSPLYGIPIRVGVETDNARVGYSSKGGLTVDAVIVDRDGSK